MTRGDLKGRKADLKGSEKEVSDLDKGELKLRKTEAETTNNSSTKSGGY